ncbi:MAG: MMPL family transporter [Methylobacter sp.]|uniref:MMPL family transporter n=1 Tax=Methylobacter sp. TaxID=2051955 RepID=UPI002583BE34|nr:MMPL family transporter [Methylobacter sp.]MCL7422706.1 MMPL family transporter [Methylobacter sp.]
MSNTTDNLLVKTILWWEENILNRPWWLLAFSVIISGFVFHYTANNLTVNTNTAEMLSPELPFQQDRQRLEKAFPQDANTILMLVEGKTPEQTTDALQRITSGLQQQKDQIRSVYIPDEGAFFDRNGLLYLSLKELQVLSTKLANAQPFIGRLSQDNSLNGLFELFGQALDASNGIELDMNAVFSKAGEALQAAQQGRPYQLSWQQLMMDRSSGLGVTKRFIIAKPVLDFQAFLPAEKSLAVIDQVIAASLTGDLADVSVRLTGEVMLEHEEMQTVSEGTAIAGIVSMFLVCITLWIAYRSFKLMFATFFTLTIGLILSLGFAAFAVGHLNMISIAFGVLFIGMGDAYSSHFCLRYRELTLRGESPRDALRDTLTSTGGSLALCTVTAAIGLFAFIPTNYLGVSELGIIAGTSLVIALSTTFTVLPAVIKIMPPKMRKQEDSRKTRSKLTSNWPLVYARPIRWVTGILAVVSLALLTRVSIDFNPINLRDPDTESVKTFKYLLQSKDTSPMTLTSLAASAAEARNMEARFESLDTVSKAVTLFDFIPENQDAKLALIEDLALILGPELDNFPEPSEGHAGIEALEKFHAILKQRLAADNNDVMARLDATLDGFLAALQSLDPEARQATLNRLEASLLQTLPSTIRMLQNSLQASEIDLEMLPKDMRERWRNQDGVYRVQALPKKDMNDLENIREFILDAQQVDPHVSDLPVSFLESMNEVILAFQQAFAVAFGVIALLLLVIMRNVKDTLLVLLPLLLASLFTAALTVLIDMPFNFANIIALPLLFGLGVDSGIHMAHRLHYLKSNNGNMLSSSEAQGVFYGTLTTIFSFGSLAFTSHLGTASMGILLAVGLLLTLVCALVVLPAFSALRFQPQVKTEAVNEIGSR